MSLDSLSPLTRTETRRTGTRLELGSAGPQPGLLDDRPRARSRCSPTCKDPGQITHIWMTQFCRTHARAGPARPGRHRHACAGAGDPQRARPELGGARPGLLPQGADPDQLGRRAPSPRCWCRWATSSASGTACRAVTRRPCSRSRSSRRSRSSSAAAPRSTAGPRCRFQKRALIEMVNENDLPLGAVLLHRLRAVSAAAAGATRCTSTRAGDATTRATAGARTCRPTARRSTSPISTAEDNYVVLETEGTRPLRRLQPVRVPLSGQLVGRGRRHDLRRRRHLAAEPARHRHRGLLQPRLGHAEATPTLSTARSSTRATCRAIRSTTDSTSPTRCASTERIKVTIEHGHANHLSDDWASTAYWYQTLPSPVATIPPLAERLPTRPDTPPTPSPAPRTGAVAEEIARMRNQRDERFAVYSSG